jgi:hypothetical protein
MDELESLVGLGLISQPGSWGFPDYLQVGNPMVGSLTWEESKTILAIWSICSSPLIISNDVRPGRVQQRVLDLFLNKEMLAVNQQYHGFAGDRMWTAPYVCSGVSSLALYLITESSPIVCACVMKHMTWVRCETCACPYACACNT